MNAQPARRISALLLGLAAAWAATPAAAEPVFPKGSSVGLEPPTGMSPAPNFTGFVDPASASSILVTEFPAEAYAQVESGMTPEILATQGVQATRSDWTSPGGRGFLLRGTQITGGQELRKWVAVIGGATETAIVTIQSPAGERSLPEAAAEAALRTIAFRAPRTAEDRPMPCRSPSAIAPGSASCGRWPARRCC